MTLVDAIRTWHPFRRPSWDPDTWVEPEWLLSRICRGGDTPLSSLDVLAADYEVADGYPGKLLHALD